MALLTAHGLACRRGDRLVFEDVGFALEPGGLLRIAGPNGSGKTSLLRLVAGLAPAAAGRIEWQGAAGDTGSEWRRQLRFLGHLDALKPVLTVRENLAAAAGLAGLADPAIAEAIRRLALDALADLPVRFLSAGQRRRAALARLALGPAALWLLDEPTTHLDGAGVAAFLALVAEHRQRGGMALVATHDDLALAPSGRLALGQPRAAP
ncbi:MAG: heme ABC exporter ATP-binding protein CcmA [Dongiaceae bacterium]